MYVLKCKDCSKRSSKKYVGKANTWKSKDMKPCIEANHRVVIEKTI